ncbi:SDR family oxidoreductase [Mucilaginibacter polytrichastri]|nr:SDR family oxidoreductase [Mucilaginibacter polytrichastri]SFT09594.1 NAD(P)-dependent dehydrogenase, short-chain alcohol dehydrogenase family [Mucilaginibacter polytrichastri]
MKKLQNKIAVITGGNSGIGLATAKLFASEGAKVAITGRDQLSVQNAVSDIGSDSIGLVSDIENLAQIDDTYQHITAKFSGKIDILIVNAAVYITGPLTGYTEEMFDKTSDINFKGSFFSVQRALPYLNDGASIVLTGSTGAEKGNGKGAAYYATKAALRSLARSFSSELLDRNIRVNVVSPGPTETPAFERTGASPEQVLKVKEALISHTPAKRLAQPEEIAQAFLYLASDDSKYMLGSELLIDGGYRTL